MEEKRNAYEIVGTNKIAIERIKEEQEQNRFIKEKAVGTIRRLSIHIEIAKQQLENTQSFREKLALQRKKIELEKKISIVEDSYRKIATKQDREIYTEELERTKIIIPRENIVEEKKNITRYQNNEGDERE